MVRSCPTLKLIAQPLSRPESSMHRIVPLTVRSPVTVKTPLTKPSSSSTDPSRLLKLTVPLTVTLLANVGTANRNRTVATASKRMRPIRVMTLLRLLTDKTVLSGEGEDRLTNAAEMVFVRLGGPCGNKNKDENR